MTPRRAVITIASALVSCLPVATQQSGVVNAPVAPEAIYVGLGGPVPGVSVIDLNGFGQGTGQLGNSRFPLNPNVGAPGVTPPLAPGTSSLDAGSAGAMTLCRNSLGGTLLVAPPTIGGVTDIHLGQPLDLLYNNENINVNALGSNQVNPATLQPQAGNSIMVAPHPNPPRLIIPSPNPARGIDGEEPTVTSSSGPPGTVTTTSPPCLPSPLNLLVPGDPFSNLPGQIGLFGANFPGVFNGPQPAPPSPPPPLAFCPYTSRQQIGHFLYALDADNDRVVVLNSNRFGVLATIPLPDPTSMAMSPNLRVLAVSNASNGTVSFIDVDPASPTFHQVRGAVEVGHQPGGLAWQPEGEDLLVCNAGDNSVSIISGSTFRLRWTVRFHINRPIDVAVTARQLQTGFQTGTYFAYVLNGDGTVAVIESGPESIGLDNTTAVLGPFPGARAIQADPTALTSGAWVVHRDAFGAAQVSRVQMTSSPVGPRPVVVSDRLNNRGRTWSVTARYGGSNATTPVKDQFSGNDAVDIAFDDIHNLGALADVPSAVVPGLVYATHSGKGHLKQTPGTPSAAHTPLFMAVALADTGRVDLIELSTGRLLRSLQVGAVHSLSHYWRQ